MKLLTSSSAVPGGRQATSLRASRSPLSRERSSLARNYRIIAAEPASCPSITQGELRYDFGDTAEMTPLMMMYTLGHDVHAAGDPCWRPALSRHVANGQPLHRSLA